MKTTVSVQVTSHHRPATAQRLRTIDLIHPATLLSLRAFDDGGIDFDTALNDDFFSADRSGATVVQRPDDGILRSPEYFFQLPGPLDLFSVTGAASATRVEERTAQRCLVSNYADGLEMAHLYSPIQSFSSAPIDGPGNFLTLRAGLHRVFGEKPLLRSQEQGEATKERRPPQLVMHVFNSTLSGRLPGFWHNRSFHPLTHPSIFNSFLPSTTVLRRLLFWDREKQEHEIEETSPEICNTLWENTRKRSRRGAPKECPRDSEDFGTDVLEVDSFFGHQPSSPAQEEAQPRGRSRKRKLAQAEGFKESDRSKLYEY
ncbi:hypothetical protein F4825DRAFT_467143 [Nemania diffusa]|nr:hypothetical protein F4825DRAFT_467143 [Nemania diffusa]